MKTCPYCQESVKDEAVKCRYCHSMLDESGNSTENDRVKYILDRDLIRFIKFSGAVLAVFGAVGLFFFGFRTQETIEKLREATRDLGMNQTQMQIIENALDERQNDLEEASNALATAQTQITTAQAQMKQLQDDLNERQNNLDQANNALVTAQTQLATAQAQMDSNQVTMSNALAELETTKSEIRELAGQAESEYLVIIGIREEARLIVRGLNELEATALVEIRSDNPEQFRDSGKLWPIGTTITLSFLDGDPSLQTKVIEIAQEWTNYANISFEFVDGVNTEAEVRISFEQAGTWSYVGTDSLAAPSGEPTINLGLISNYSDDELAAVTLHEFGHMLGLLHEHQNPNANIPWDEDAVYEYYRVRLGWSTVEVDQNILSTWEPDYFPVEKEFDPRSIMLLFDVPNDLTEGDFVLSRQFVLSEGDKEFIAILYPLE